MRMHRKKWRVLMVYGQTVLYEHLNSIKIAREIYDRDIHARALQQWHDGCQHYKIIMCKP